MVPWKAKRVGDVQQPERVCGRRWYGPAEDYKPPPKAAEEFRKSFRGSWIHLHVHLHVHLSRSLLQWKLKASVLPSGLSQKHLLRKPVLTVRRLSLHSRLSCFPFVAAWQAQATACGC